MECLQCADVDDELLRTVGIHRKFLKVTAEVHVDFLSAAHPNRFFEGNLVEIPVFDNEVVEKAPQNPGLLVTAVNTGGHGIKHAGTVTANSDNYIIA